MNSSPVSAPQPPAPYNIEPVPPEPAYEEPPQEILPRISRNGDSLILEGNPAIPTDLCLKSGRPATNTLTVSLRNPRNPMTWFGKRPKIEIGLCRKHYENHSVALALTWSLMAVGAILLVVSVLTFSFLSALVGLAAIGISGIFRAASPVTLVDATDSFATIDGVAEPVLSQFPSYEEG